MRPPFCWRMATEAARLVLNVPFRCTARTASHSSSLMLNSMRSRRMPATFTRMSIFPHRETIWSTISAALA